MSERLEGWCSCCDAEDVPIIEHEVTAGPGLGVKYTVCLCCWHAGWSEHTGSDSPIATLVRLFRYLGLTEKVEGTSPHE